MGVSPKKRTAPGAESFINPDHLKRFGITVALCCTMYLLTIPARGGSGSSLFSVTRVNRTKAVLPRSKNDLGFWDKPELGEFFPQIAWLMSYPNSGTSFTMTCVEHTSNLSTASNYGDEVTAKDDYSISIYPQHLEGPFWEGLSGKLGVIRPLPERHVLVKTHCGSRCIKCPPSEYVETYDSFLDACRRSSGRIAPDRKKTEYLYPADRVTKAIHLIRNPYHNFVARYHLERKNAIAKKKEDWLKEHPSTPEGFQQWCLELDNMYKKEEFATFEADMVRKLRLSPCHGEVFKFVQWHNLAFKLTQKRGIERMIVYYEDYDAKFNETLDGMLDFLELGRAQKPRTFEAGHEYADYYTANDKIRMKELVQEIASDVTWNHIKHYFDKHASKSFYETDLSADRAPKRGADDRLRG